MHDPTSSAQSFVTRDLALAATLKSAGYDPAMVPLPGPPTLVAFVFAANAPLLDVVRAYELGELRCDPRRFSEAKTAIRRAIDPIVYRARRQS